MDTKSTGKPNWQKKSERWASSFFDHLKSKRVTLFVEKLRLGPDDIVLDLGSEDGSYLAKYYPYPENVIIADIDEAPLKDGVRRYGLRGYRVISPNGPLPFRDKEFDAVWCNSVIEHVTVSRDQLGDLTNNDFIQRADLHQEQFAKEIARTSNAYFVQTPNKHFPIESHSILPLVAYFPHPLRYRLSTLMKRIWIKQWTSDFYLYDRRRFRHHFSDATAFLDETSLGITKSFIAVRTDRLAE